MQVDSLQYVFSEGIRRGLSRDSMGKSRGGKTWYYSLWDCKDFILDRLGVPLGKRGPWTYEGGVLGSYPIRGLVEARMNGGNFLLAVDSNGDVYRTDLGGDWAIDGTTRNVGQMLQNPIFSDEDVFYPSETQTWSRSNENTVVDYGDAAMIDVGNLGFGVRHKGRIWAANTGGTVIASPSNPGSDEVPWDILAAYGTSERITGLASVSGVGGILLVFHEGSIERLYGGTPAGYGVTEDDISIDGWTQEIGCISAFSIANWSHQVLWCDRNSAWLSDGVAMPLDLAWAGGAKDLYREFILQYDADVHRISAGVFSDLYIICLTNIETNVAVDTLVVDLKTRAWTRMTNFPFTCFQQENIPGTVASQTFAGTEGNRVAGLAGIFTEGETDANSVDIEPVFETAYYRLGLNNQRTRNIYIGYKIENSQDYSTVLAQATALSFTLRTPGVYPYDGGVQIDFVAGAELGVVMTGYDPLVPLADIVHITITFVDGETTCADIPSLLAANGKINSLLYATNGSSADIVAEGPIFLETSTADDTGKLNVSMSGDLSPDPVFSWDRFYDGDSIPSVSSIDLKNEDNQGFHWRKLPMNLNAPGFVLKVEQDGKSFKTHVYSIGHDSINAPSYKQR